MKLPLLILATLTSRGVPTKIKLNLGGDGGDGGFLGGLGELLQGLSGAAKQKKDGTCPSHCEDLHPDDHWEVSPAPKERIRPYSNGCSVPSSMRDGLGDYSHFERCCHLHDTCYMSCGVPKNFCEKEFSKCMIEQCQKKYKKRAHDLRGCNEKAGMFVTGTAMFGCGGYIEMQRHGCDCLKHNEAERRVNEYARQFYEAYNQTHPLPQKVVSMFLEHEDHVAPSKRNEKHGMLLYKLYKRYPKSIDVISRDGKRGRPEAVLFDLPERHAEL